MSYLENIIPSQPFEFALTTPLEITQIIQDLSNTGAGIDGLSTKILKLLIPTITPHLVHLFNLCLSEGNFPSHFKRAIVVPIFKSGSPFSFTNYRPISLLPVLSKVLEKIVYSQLIAFFTNEEFLYPLQFGFRKNHSTYMPISLLYEKITCALSKNKTCSTIYLDFSKAFNTVNPAILLSKLDKYGVRNTALTFFTSYLTNRQQVVRCKSSTSGPPKLMTLGVPQGSVLGPLLFLIYINDIKHSTPSIDFAEFYLFADDTALYLEEENCHQLQQSINQNLPHIITWLNCNRLTINAKKSNYQLFSNNKTVPDLNISIHEHPIQRCFTVKYLGVLIDEDLRWTSHIRSVENKVSRNIGMIGRAKFILNSDQLLLLHNSLILPFISYGLGVWGSTYVTKLNRLFILQKRIIRIIDHAEPLAHTAPLFKKYHVLKVHDLVTFTHLKVLHNFLCDKLPAPLADKLALAEPPINPRTARDPRHFVTPFVLTNYRQFSLFITAPERWNDVISKSIRDIADVPRSQPFFKKVVKKLFIDKY